MPTKDAHRPLPMNNKIVRRSVGIPALRAPSLSPPKANAEILRRIDGDVPVDVEKLR